MRRGHDSEAGPRGLGVRGSSATTMYREMDMRFWLVQAEAEVRALK